MAEFAHLAGTVYLASSEFSGFGAAKAFDNLFGTLQYWLGTSGGVDWLRVDTNATAAGGINPWLITSYKIAVNTIPEASRAPKNWTFEGSADASAWTVLDTQINQTAWASGEQREFTLTGVGPYRYFRVNITANNGDATYTQIAELYLYGDATYTEFAHISGSAYAASSAFSGFPAANAFDNGIGSGQYWLGTGSGVDWLRVYTGAVDAWLIGAYRIAVNTIPEPNRAPKNWTLEGSNDASAWTVLDTRINQTAWTSGEHRGFAVTGAASYHYFRVNITANNGDATYTQIAELYLYGDTGGAPAAVSIRQTQAALEFAYPTAALAVRETQAAFEHVGFPPNAIWATQVCLEVLFPAADFVPPVVTVRNYAYTGLWART